VTADELEKLDEKFEIKGLKAERIEEKKEADLKTILSKVWIEMLVIGYSFTITFLLYPSILLKSKLTIIES
jgi:hypothetical protein